MATPATVSDNNSHTISIGSTEGQISATRAIETSTIAQSATVAQIEATEVDALSNVILGTALLRLKLEVGVTNPLRALCDSGSQLNLITKACANRIGLIQRPMKLRFRGVDGIAGLKARGIASAAMYNK